MAVVRRILFQVHMWIGLVLGVLFVALGLSGSVLVYHDELDRLTSATPHVATQGPQVSLDTLETTARIALPNARGSLLITMPEEAGDPVLVRVLAPPGRGAGRPQQSPSLYLDPVSGAVIGKRASAMSPLVQFAHDLHGGLMMGRDGRPYVGCLGVGMVLLGLTGLVLWWPKPHQWKYAFRVRWSAKGLRFNRELHAAVGIWSFIVFIIVSFTGVVVAFPDTTRAAIGGGSPPTFNLRTGPDVEPVRGVKRIGADEAVRVAMTAKPDSDLVSVMVPSKRTQAISVALTPHGENAAILSMVYVDPYRAHVMATRDPAALSAADSFLAWQRPLHQGDGLGPLWRFLVFLSGFLPLLFVVTGVTMWVKKRRARLSMTEPLAEGAVS